MPAVCLGVSILPTRGINEQAELSQGAAHVKEAAVESSGKAKAVGKKRGRAPKKEVQQSKKRASEPAGSNAVPSAGSVTQPIPAHQVEKELDEEEEPIHLSNRQKMVLDQYTSRAGRAFTPTLATVLGMFEQLRDKAEQYKAEAESYKQSLEFHKGSVEFHKRSVEFWMERTTHLQQQLSCRQQAAATFADQPGATPAGSLIPHGLGGRQD